jgi:hypothetical protein
MARSKLCVRRLTLAPGALGQARSEEGVDVLVDEINHIMDRENLHRAVEVSIESSLSRRTRLHIHGVEERIGGHFWLSGNESDSESQRRRWKNNRFFTVT